MPICLTVPSGAVSAGVSSLSVVTLYRAFDYSRELQIETCEVKEVQFEHFTNSIPHQSGFHLLAAWNIVKIHAYSALIRNEGSTVVTTMISDRISFSPLEEYLDK